MRTRCYVLLALAVVAPAQEVPQRPSQESEQRPSAQVFGSIEGKVTDRRSGVPLGKARVGVRSVEAASTSTSPNLYLPANTSPMVEAATDDAGVFRLKNLPPGTYRIIAGRDGFVDLEYGAAGPLLLGTPVRVLPGQQLSAVNFELLPREGISGRVLDENRRPMAGVEVSAVRSRYLGSQRIFTDVGRAVTSEKGEYQISQLEPGKYYIKALKRGPPPTRKSDPDEPEESYVRTYFPRALEPANGELLEVRAGVPLEHIDVTLAKTRTVRLRGRLTFRSGVPKQRGVKVYLRSIENGLGAMPFTQTNGPEDRFEFAGVLPGHYTLFAFVDGGQLPFMAKLPVDVGLKDVENVELVVSPGVPIRGEIIVEDGGPIDFRKLEIDLAQAGGSNAGATWAPHPPGMVNADGTFAFQSVNLDHYVFHINGLPQGFYIKSIEAGGREALEETMDLSTGASPPLRVVISGKAASIRGVVLDDKQKPAPGSIVVLVPDSLKRREKARFYKEAVADQYGRFQTQNVTPGDYQIVAWEKIEFRSWMDPTVFVKYDGSGTKLSLQAAESKEVELKRIPGQ